jgi:hypothetical protein
MAASQVIENQKMRAESFDDESDMVDAFVACGGQPSKSGHVKRDTLVSALCYQYNQCTSCIRFEASEPAHHYNLKLHAHHQCARMCQ